MIENSNFLLLIFPIPTAKSKLGSNQTKGLHYYAIAKSRKIARTYGFYLTQQQLKKSSVKFSKTDKLLLNINCYFKNDKRMDDDNIITSLKGYRDGVFEVLKEKFGLNDKQIIKTILDCGFYDKQNPRVEWKLSNF